VKSKKRNTGCYSAVHAKGWVAKNLCFVRDRRIALIVLFLIPNIFFYCTEQNLNESKDLSDVIQDTLQIGYILQCPKISHRIGGGNLSHDSKDSVKVIADIIKSNPDFIFEISSHTDHRGASNMNLKLSEKHADFLRMYLINEHGITPERVTAKGNGESTPIIPIDEIENSDDEEKERLHAINSRYELRVIGKVD